MAIIEIKNLPAGTPTQSKKLPMDLVKAESATIKDIVFAGRPAASQAEAEAGVDAEKVMTAIATKQSIAFEVGVSIASAANGALASTALQAADAVTNYVSSVTSQSFSESQKDQARNNIGLYSLFKDFVIVNGIPVKLSSSLGDAAANQTLLNAVVAATSGAILIEFGMGVFYLQRMPLLTNRHVVIRGQGWGVTSVVFTGTSSPDIEITQNSLIYNNEVYGIEFLRSGSTTLSCVSVTRPIAASGATHRGPVIKDCYFNGKDGATWQVQVNLVEGWNYIIEHNHFKGADTTLVGQGIRLTGASTDGKITGNVGVALDYGILSPSASFSEGAVVTGNKWVGVNFGAFFDNGANAPGGHFVNNHVASFKTAVSIFARSQWHITNNLLYRQSASASGWIGIYIGAACGDTHVKDNTIESPTANSVSGDAGIYALSAGDVQVVGNIVRNLYTVIDGGGTLTGLVAFNTYTGQTQAIVNTGAANVINNYSVPT